MAKYLVTGIAGFIGSSIAHELVSRGETVRGLDDLSTGKRENIADIQSDIDFREVSLLDKPGLASACAGIDYVIHQAALPSVPKSVAEPELTHAVNVNGTLNLLIAARDAGAKRLVYAASSSAYGESEVLPKKEDMPPRPISPYAVQKLTGEYYLQTFSAVYGLETVSLRYFNIFGPRQDANSQYSGVLAKFITQMQLGQSPTIFGDGEQSRDFTFVANAVQANLKACVAPAKEGSGRVFNIATGTRFSLNQIYGMLSKIIGFSGTAKYAGPRTGDVRHSLADISLAQKHLGYSADISFEEGLRRTVAWYETQRGTTTSPRVFAGQLNS
ncbi:MAG TPA: SDR family oxidoreductase [Candidatus Angelobacter sp.]|jgi:UDP-glucose 4-epimerase|nr:SDR family oxidoreductase [Candidatus Angelobacter sp.]